MMHKTRGIVLRTVDYSDTSIIASIYTEQFGIQSYFIKGARRKNASVKANLFFPLSLLEMVVYKKENKHLQTIREIKPEFLPSVSISPAKTSVIFFINEILFKCLQEEEKNREMFSFLHESIELLHADENNFMNFHLIFLVRLSRFLGFFPQGNFSETTSVFDLRDGKFIAKEPVHHDFIGKKGSELLNKLIVTNFYSMENMTLSGKERKYLLNTLLQFYQLHLSNTGPFVSHKVLEQVLA